MTPSTTTVGLASGKETLTFGTDYVVGLSTSTGRTDAFTGRLESRSANGDLVFLTDSSGTTRRIKARAILSIEPDQPVAPLSPETEEVIGLPGAQIDADGRPDFDLGEVVARSRNEGETAAAFLARLEREIPLNYVAFVESDPGQALLREAARETNAARKASRKPKAESNPADAFTRDERTRIIAAIEADQRVETTIPAAEIAATFVTAERALSPETFNEGIAADLAAYVEAKVVEVRGVREAKAAHRERVQREAKPGRYAAGVAATRVVLDGEVVAEKRAAKPYAERNQVWKCSECKRRTRQPSCSNGHPEVTAPVGKRRDDRAASA